MRRQLAGDGTGRAGPESAAVRMGSTLARELSNEGLTISGLQSRYGSRREAAYGREPDRRPQPGPAAAHPPGRETPDRLRAGRGGGDLPLPRQRPSDEACGRGADPGRGQRPSAAVRHRRAARGGRARGADPDRAAIRGALAPSGKPFQEPALGADVLRPPGRCRRRHPYRRAAGPRPHPPGRRRIHADAGRRRPASPTSGSTSPAWNATVGPCYAPASTGASGVTTWRAAWAPPWPRS